MHPGKFITLEGSEGGGKSTNLLFIRDYLTERGIPCCITREPGGTALGESIRAILLGEQDIVAEAELLLLFAARAQHIQTVIAPALAKGLWVISDRFTEASYAYQGGGRGIRTDIIGYLQNWIQGEVRPDLTLLLDVPLATGQARIQARGQPDRIEREDAAFFERVRSTYLNRAALPGSRIQIIDASQPLTTVQTAIATHLTPLMPS